VGHNLPALAGLRHSKPRGGGRMSAKAMKPSLSPRNQEKAADLRNPGPFPKRSAGAGRSALRRFRGAPRGAANGGPRSRSAGWVGNHPSPPAPSPARAGEGAGGGGPAIPGHTPWANVLRPFGAKQPGSAALRDTRSVLRAFEPRRGELSQPRPTAWVKRPNPFQTASPEGAR